MDQLRKEILRAIDTALTPSKSNQPDSQSQTGPDPKVPFEEFESNLNQPDLPVQTEVFDVENSQSNQPDPQQNRLDSEVPHEEIESELNEIDSPLETEVFESLYRHYQTDIQSLQEVLNKSNKMDETRIDEVHEEIEILLRRCTEEELKQVAIDIEINTDALTRRQLLREIENKINATTKEDLWKFLKDLNFPDRLKDEHINFFRSTPMTKQDKKITENDIAKIRDEQKILLENIQKSQRHSSALEDSFRNLGIVGNNKTSTFRKELKITGTIGGKKEQRLDYLSLCSQIAEARQRGYEEDEICFAIKKAVSPSSGIKAYLDSLHTNVSLNDVLTCVRSSYQEKSVSELFQDLTKMCQSSSENAQEFLFRALGLRQKVQAASNATEDIRYDPSLIQQTFLHSVLTGLKSETVRSHIKPFLDKNCRAKDCVLIEEMGRVCAEENERISKMNTNWRKEAPKVQEVSTGMKDLAEQLKSLGEQMKEVKAEMVSMKKDGKPSWKKSKCDACSQKNERFCSHCFKCGQEGHQSRNCQGVKPSAPSPQAQGSSSN